MKRPHSAKPMRSFVPQVAGEEGSFEDPRPFLKPGKRQLVGAASNDLSRLLPKKIHHDKEQLYHENLQLKSALNEASEENLRLKTKIALYQREKDRLHKTDAQALGRGKSANNLNAAKGEKQNGIVSGLKKLVREAREEKESLVAEVSRLKKSLRYTKLNEVEVEKQTVYDQNKKLARLIQQYETELTSRVRQEQAVELLQAELNEKTRTLQEVTSDNMRYQQILEEVEAQCRQASQKLLIQEKKWQRNFAVERRKFEQLSKHVELLKNEVKSLSLKLEEERKKGQQRKPARPASSHPYTSADAPKNRDLKEKEEAMQANSRLKLQLEEAKKKLAESENKLKKTGKNATNTLELSKNQTFELNLTKEEQNQTHSKQEEEYGSDFQETNTKPPQNIHSLPIEQKPKSRSSKPQPKLSPIMSEIKELLTYRLKYNRYTFEQLRSDIEVSPDSSFIYEDLMNMLTSEPFYLTPHYAGEFLRTCYGRTNIHSHDELDLQQLVWHLRMVIEDFELQEEEEEECMLYKIAENLSRNRKALEAEFGRVRDAHNCVTKAELARVLKSVSKISEEEIELAVCYISVNIETLQAISYTDFLDRFYINRNNSKSLSASRAPHEQQEDLSMGEDQSLEEGELIDDELI